jgi:sarcosine oxidase subunit alpha
MFQRLPDAKAKPLNFSIDGKPATGSEGDSVAAALLLAGRRVFRETAVTGAARGPWCLMGACHDCYVAIDGVANQQACLVRLREGMRVETQHGRREFGR